MRRRLSALLVALGLAAVGAVAPAGAKPVTGDGRAGGQQPAGSSGGTGGSGGSGGSPQPAGPVGNPIGRSLGSPQCAKRGSLGPRERRNCELSGTIEQRVPLDNYAFDIHIDTSDEVGVGPVNADVPDVVNAGHSLLQNVVIQPIWQGLLYVLRGVFWLLEWAFSIDLLGGEMGTVGEALRRAQSVLADPWTTFAMAAAGAWVLWTGIVRRRTAASVAGVALMVAMMLVAIWLISRPADSVGYANRAVQDASLGTLSAINTGNPNRSERDFGAALADVYDRLVQPSWCMLEFGDTDWCMARAEPDLREQTRTAIEETRSVAGELPDFVLDDAPELAQALEARQRAIVAPAEALVRDPKASNGEMFLGFPAGSDARNGDEEWTLHSWLAARHPEHNDIRSEGGTVMRFALVLLIVLGTVGAILLLGWTAVHLVMASVLTVLWLLMAPLMMLAPAFGDAGRGVFRAWGKKLLTALAGKLVFSVFLAVVLLTARLLSQLAVDSGSSPGRLGGWLLLTVFWWIAFMNRQEAIGLLTGGHPVTPASGVSPTRIAGTALGGLRSAGRLAVDAGQHAISRTREPPEPRPDPRRRTVAPADTTQARLATRERDRISRYDLPARSHRRRRRRTGPEADRWKSASAPQSPR